MENAADFIGCLAKSDFWAKDRKPFLEGTAFRNGGENMNKLLSSKAVCC